VHYVDQGVTVQGQITDIGAKVHKQLSLLSSTCDASTSLTILDNFLQAPATRSLSKDAMH